MLKHVKTCETTNISTCTAGFLTRFLVADRLNLANLLKTGLNTAEYCCRTGSARVTTSLQH